jgi:hypothetical protein
MPLYDSATVATALDIPAKWLDNLLSHNKIDGVSAGRQGVRRRLSAESVRIVAVIRELTIDAGIPVPVAARIAAAALGGHAPGAAGSTCRVALSRAVAIEIDLAALDREIRAGLVHAVEVTPHPARGRPRRPRRS